MSRTEIAGRIKGPLKAKSQKSYDYLIKFATSCYKLMEIFKIKQYLRASDPTLFVVALF